MAKERKFVAIQKEAYEQLDKMAEVLDSPKGKVASEAIKVFAKKVLK